MEKYSTPYVAVSFVIFYVRMFLALFPVKISYFFYEMEIFSYRRKLSRESNLTNKGFDMACNIPFKNPYNYVKENLHVCHDVILSNRFFHCYTHLLRKCVQNAIVTWCEDNTARIWKETCISSTEFQVVSSIYEVVSMEKAPEQKSKRRSLRNTSGRIKALLRKIK